MLFVNMGPRRKARHAVLEALYAVEILGCVDDPEKTQNIWNYCVERQELSDKAEFFGENLFKIILRNLPTTDNLIAKNLQNWKLARVALIDRNILRIGVCEILFVPDVPRKASIDESIEMAKKYSTKDSSRFVNGVLDNITRDSIDEIDNPEV
ncbi:MAG: transcription antitermination factor NusB [candidate division Zixibacteria bacterium]|nr:transcription antitermination factor NusB [candidate division Zixibacteria bacterium]